MTIGSHHQKSPKASTAHVTTGGTPGINQSSSKLASSVVQDSINIMLGDFNYPG